MSSTLNSNTIVSIKKLNVFFDFNHHQVHNLRDSFINILKSPIKYFFKGKELNHVIKDLDLEVRKGDRLGIVGVNGTGKSTLCRTIAGMCYAKKGNIKVNGNIRAIFDTSVGIIGELTGRENAQLIVELLFPELTNKEKRDFVEEAIEFCELGEYIDTPYNTYSKGMQSRLCLSLISGHASDLLILDEVFDGADEFFQKKIAKRVLSMIEKSGAVIFVSHSVEQIRLACNRLVVLKGGYVAFDGDIEAGLDYYHSLYEENSL